MKLKLLILSVMLSASWQLNCINKIRFNLGIGTTILGIGSLAWQVYNKDYSLKKSLITGSLFATSIASFLWSDKKQADPQIKPYGKMPILRKQIKDITDNKDYEKLQKLIHSYSYTEVNKAFNDHNHNLFVTVMNWYKDGVISAQQFYNLGLDNLGWDKIINAYKYGYLHIGHMREILVQITAPQEINNLSIKESVDYNDDNQWVFLGDVMSPLHYAVQNDKTLPLAQLLIEEAGADIYMHSKNGHSVYDYALNYTAFETVKYIKQYVKLQIALGLNCRDIVFSGSKARKFCIDQLKPDIVASKNPHELEKIGNQMMEDRMKNGLNARALPTEVIEHITGYVLAPNL